MKLRVHLLSLLLIFSLTAHSQFFFDTHFVPFENSQPFALSGYDLVEVSEDVHFAVFGGTLNGDYITRFYEYDAGGDFTGNTFSLNMSYNVVGRNSVIYHEGHLYVAGVENIDGLLDRQIIVKCDVNGNVITQRGLGCYESAESEDVPSGDGPPIKYPDYACFGTVIDLGIDNNNDLLVYGMDNYNHRYDKDGAVNFSIAKYDANLNYLSLSRIEPSAQTEHAVREGIVFSPDKSRFGVSYHNKNGETGSNVESANLFNMPCGNNHILTDGHVLAISNDGKFVISDPDDIYSGVFSFEECDGNLITIGSKIEEPISTAHFITNDLVIASGKVSTSTGYCNALFSWRYSTAAIESVKVLSCDPYERIESVNVFNSGKIHILLSNANHEDKRVVGLGYDFVNSCLSSSEMQDPTAAGLTYVPSETSEFNPQVIVPYLVPEPAEYHSDQNCCTYALDLEFDDITICCTRGDNNTDIPNWEFDLPGLPSFNGTGYYTVGNGGTVNNNTSGSSTYPVQIINGHVNIQINEPGLYHFYFEDENGCYGQAFLNVLCFEFEPIDSPFAGTIFCFSRDNSTPEVFPLPSNGEWSGNGVVGTPPNQFFDLWEACTGTHTLSYSYIDANGCRRDTTFDVDVNTNCIYSTYEVTICVPEQSDFYYINLPTLINVGSYFSHFEDGNGNVIGNSWLPPGYGVYNFSECYVNANCTVCFPVEIIVSMGTCKSFYNWQEVREDKTLNILNSENSFSKVDVINSLGQIVTVPLTSAYSIHEVEQNIRQHAFASGIYHLLIYSTNDNLVGTSKIFIQ